MPHVIVMGVAGCGKSTIAKAVAEHLACPFLEGDDLHSAANIEKMSRGEALTDDDRWPWLQSIGETLAGFEQGSVTSCSALKRAYRDRICDGAGVSLHFIHLAASQSLILERMQSRKNHFMPPSLLASQFDALEPLQPDEAGITLDISGSVDEIVADGLAYLEQFLP